MSGISMSRTNACKTAGDAPVSRQARQRRPCNQPERRIAVLSLWSVEMRPNERKGAND